MQAELDQIPLQEVLHFLGWHGSALDKELLSEIRRLSEEAVRIAEPRIVSRRFRLIDGTLKGTGFRPQGKDIRQMLAPCSEVILIAATLGASAERMLLRAQAQSAARSLLLDAVLSAAIEAVLDRQEEALQRELSGGLYLTDRFSPGYGDMPLEQSKSICEILDAQRQIGLTVSASGIMIPRKSVTAIMGVSDMPVPLRPKGCQNCDARATCALRRGRERKAGTQNE